jgi:uncharacterized protein (DUF427 family)
VWTYEQPFDAVAEIKDYLAFYTGVPSGQTVQLL